MGDHAMPALPLIVFDRDESFLDPQTMEPIFKRVFDKRDMPSPIALHRLRG
jgi:hypothetical protein